MDSCAQFLAVAEHRFIPAGARSVGHRLRKAGYHSVWAPACQESVAGGHAGVGVVSLGGAPLALPSFVAELGRVVVDTQHSLYSVTTSTVESSFLVLRYTSPSTRIL